MMKTKNKSYQPWQWSLVTLAFFSLVVGHLSFAKMKPAQAQVLPPEEDNIVTMAGTDLDLGNGGPAIAVTLNQPQGIAVDSAGNFYIVQVGSNLVRKVATDGIITTVAGNGLTGSAGDGGQATAAQLNNPRDAAVDAAGDLYISEFLGNRIRKVNMATGIITTVAGTGGAGYAVRCSHDTTVVCTNGMPNPNSFCNALSMGSTCSIGDNIPATAAQIGFPRVGAFDAAGNLHITAGGRVRKIDKITGIITTVAGGCGPSPLIPCNPGTGEGGLATAAQLGGLDNVAFDPAGNLHITTANRVRKVDKITGIITTVAGTGVQGYASCSVSLSACTSTSQCGAGGGTCEGDGILATAAQLNTPGGLAFDPVGNYYIADFGNSRVRMVDTAGFITTVAGTGVSGFNGDNISATAAQLRTFRTLALDSAGSLYIADDGNGRIRKVTAGIITTVAGGVIPDIGDDGPATAALFDLPFGTAFDPAGNLYIAEVSGRRVRKVNLATGIITTVAGGGTIVGADADGGPATAALLNATFAVAVDPAGNLYIADFTNNRIRKVVPGSDGVMDGLSDPDPEEIITTFAGIGAGGYLAVCSHNLALACTTNTPTPLTCSSLGGTCIGDNILATAARVSGPQGLTVAAGDLYIGDLGNGRVRKVNLATRIITTVAGGGTTGLGDNGPATSAQLNTPRGMAFDSAGRLYIANVDSRVRRVTPGTNGIDGLVPQSPPGSCTAPMVMVVGTNFCRDPGEIIMTFAGTGVAGFSGDGGQAALAQLNTAFGVAIDSADILYIAENTGSRVREVDLATGIITTAVGTGVAGFPMDGGPAALAQLNAPRGVTVDVAGNVYIADGASNRIRRLNLASPVVIGPGTLNVSSKGQWGTATIQFPDDWDASQVDLASVMLQLIDPANGSLQHDLNGVIQTERDLGSPMALNDTNGDSVPDQLILKYDRATIIDWASCGEDLALRVEGQFQDGRYFSGDTEIGVNCP